MFTCEATDAQQDCQGNNQGLALPKEVGNTKEPNVVQ